MRMLVAAAFALAALAGCREDKIEVDWLSQDIASLSTGSLYGAERVSGHCCRRGSEAACTALRATLHDKRLVGLADFLLREVDVRCSNIPSSEAIAFLRHHWPGDQQGRVQSFRLLREREATPEVVQVYLDELADPYVRYSLPLLGDEELALVAARVNDADPQIRQNVRWALADALVAPVDDLVLRVIERVNSDPDVAVSATVSRELREYKQAARSPDEAVAYLLAHFEVTSSEFTAKHPWGPQDPIILLGVRRAFCASAAATRALDDFAKSPDPKIAAIAVQSIAVRAKRCHR